MDTHRSPRILVVDEEQPITHILRLALELEGWQIESAATGAAALATGFDPDIVLLDMELPDQSGTRVVSALRAAGSSAVVVFLTGRSDHEDRVAAYAAGADDYLTKPFGVEEIVEHLRPVVRRLGLAASSRRVDDLVFDTDAGVAWRGGEFLPLTPLEFELLRELVERRGRRVSVGELTRAAARRGVRIPIEFTARMLERIRRAVNASGRVLLVSDDSGWVLG